MSAPKGIDWDAALTAPDIHEIGVLGLSQRHGCHERVVYTVLTRRNIRLPRGDEAIAHRQRRARMDARLAAAFAECRT